MYVLRDFNINIRDQTTNTSSLLTSAERCGYTQEITDATREQNIIDLVFVKPTSEVVVNSSCVELGLSDHNLQHMEVAAIRPTIKKRIYVYRDFKHADWVSVLSSFVECEHALMRTEGTEQFCKALLTKTRNAQSCHIPNKSFDINEGKPQTLISPKTKRLEAISSYHSNRDTGAN